jgi:hypothetical protein
MYRIPTNDCTIASPHIQSIDAKSTPLKYVATIHNVRELCLVGRADLDFWSDRLTPEGITPASFDGRAELWLSAVALKWLGIYFQELSVAVRLEPDRDSQPRVFLVAAFSTSRALAWCERTFFQTPYEHAEIELHAAQPWSFELQHAGQTTLAAASHKEVEITHIDETWAGKILLPTADTRGVRKLFHAQLTGQTEIAPFTLTGAQFTLHPTIHQPVLKLLADSNFSPTEWRVRPTATHARSKAFAA